MDRTEYLQLCQLNAAYPKSRKVKYEFVRLNEVEEVEKV